MRALLLLVGAIGKAVASSEAVDCRITVEHIAFSELVHSHKLACIPLDDNGDETDNVFPLSNIPSDFIRDHHESLHSSNSHVRIEGVNYIADEALTVHKNATFFMKPSYESRRLRSRRLSSYTPGTKGRRTLGVVRVCIKSANGRKSCPKFSVPDLHKGIFGNGYTANGVTVVSQFHKCSGGQLKFVPNRFGIQEVTVPKGNNDRGEIEKSVQKFLKQKFKLSKMSEFASNSMFIFPPGFEFLAVAPSNHWRSSYSDAWGLSLVANLHEIGHNFDLGHAYYNNRAYGGVEGNMGGGSAMPGGPLKCYNAVNHFRLGWFEDRTLTLGKGDVQTATLVPVAAFVDYDLTEKHQPVNIRINNKYFIQYNRRAKHNIGTQAFADKLTVSTYRNSHSTDHYAALSPGRGVNLAGGIRLQVCQRIPGNSRTPDILLLSIGQEGNACSQVPVAAPLPGKATEIFTSQVANLSAPLVALAKRPECKYLTDRTKVNHVSTWKERQGGKVTAGNGSVRWRAPIGQRHQRRRRRRISGFSYQLPLDYSCLVPGSRWEVSAEIRLLRAGTSISPASCQIDPTSWRQGCPSLFLQHQNGEKKKTRMFLAGHNKALSWNAATFNKFQVVWTVPGTGNAAATKLLRLSWGSFPDNTDVVVKNFEMKLI